MSVQALIPQPAVERSKAGAVFRQSIYGKENEWCHRPYVEQSARLDKGRRNRGGRPGDEINLWLRVKLPPMSPEQRLHGYSGLNLSPGLGETEIRDFERSLPGRLPDEIVELLAYAAGFTSSFIGSIDFTGRSFRFEFDGLVPHGLPIAKTVEGNSWVVDVGPLGEWKDVFYFCHDPPVMVVHFDSLDAFIYTAVSGKEIVEQATLLAHEVWGNLNSGLAVADALHSADEHISEFARSLPESGRIFDLRNGSHGRGFAWGRESGFADCRRFNSHLIFAIVTPIPKSGLFSRLLKRE